MNSQELEKRNKTLERRWKIMLALVIIFLVTRPIALYIVNNLIHKAAHDATSNDYPLIDPARQFISQSDYIVNLQDLRTYLADIGNKYPDQASIYYEQLNSGANISVNKSLRLFPASLTKLPLAIVVGRKIEDGMWKWNDKLTIQQSDIDSGSGSLFKSVKAGDSLPIDDLLTSLISDSDNTAQKIFLRQMQQSDFDKFESEVGLEDLFDNEGFISAKQYSTVLRVLYTSSYLERADSEKILNLMAQEKFHDYLSQGFPSDITFAHKFGENSAQSIFADSGILYVENHPFMITVILKGADSTQVSREWAVGLMKEISTKVYETSKEKIGYVAK